MKTTKKSIKPKTPGLFLGLDVLEGFWRSQLVKLITFRAKKLFHTIFEKNHQLWGRKYFLIDFTIAK